MTAFNKNSIIENSLDLNDLNFFTVIPSYRILLRLPQKHLT